MIGWNLDQGDRGRGCGDRGEVENPRDVGDLQSDALGTGPGSIRCQRVKNQSLGRKQASRPTAPPGVSRNLSPASPRTDAADVRRGARTILLWRWGAGWLNLRRAP